MTVSTLHQKCTVTWLPSVTWDAIRSTQFCSIISTTLIHNNAIEIEKVLYGTRWIGISGRQGTANFVFFAEVVTIL